jgi:hypothetical protein
MLVIDTRLCVGGTCMVAIDVAAMGMVIVPIFKPLEWGRQGLRCALGGIIAATTIEGHTAALIVSATATVASVESVSIAAIVRATATTPGLSLLALVFLLATPAASFLMIFIVLLWVLKHPGRGLVANGVAEHLDLPLHSIDGGIVVA